ncbi:MULTISPECIES: site-specific DNA-methyltransferase [Vibrio harveyi group]|uniref:site-specific DNA-methyltransferase n=1 Tax=Vibrio harveyi group TaxID=717610 RepID=UPI001BD45D1C|nr:MULTISPECIES: site-specific DNA-methyltransferase [Vibrio harveyi group]MBT0090765.1 site-specific DNA-methyltransferase [Vibrio alginolyticus]MCS0368449.1 site-specific DNA-methyltransferase [Vibrio diabolicus]
MTQTKKQKLELTWIGKEKQPRLEPRIFLEDGFLSYQGEAKDGVFNDNLLIHGDNLLALKALEQDYSSKVKCICIDPPYNTGTAFAEYDDGLEHSMWLSLIRDRLILLRSLLTDDGSIWISIDDNEQAYLKVLCDEIFGRGNFVASIIWEKRKTRENRRVFSFNHDFVLVYAKNKHIFDKIRNPLPMTAEIKARYKNPDNDHRGPWQSISALAQAGHGTASQFYDLTTPSGRVVSPPKGNCWRYSNSRMQQEIAEGRIWFGKSGDNAPRIKKYLAESKDSGVTPETLWKAEDVGTTDSAKKHVNQILHDTSFDTPKPEELIERIIHIASNPGDLVLDSFAGSGTTGAVAQKMGRRWIMVELGDHCETHIVPRLKKVIDGEDQGGISKAVNWQGGGGFRYLRLAPSLLQKDEWGNWVINKEYNAEMLSAAMCKHMGFTYSPSETQFWNHGYSTETDFIYVTTGALAYDQLKRISEEVGEERTLLICCKAFMSEGADFPNLTIKKIPQSILNKCEWDNDDYSFTLNVLAEPEEYEFDDEEE